MIDAGENVVPRTCPVHGINRCRPKPFNPLIADPFGGVLKPKCINKIYLAGPMRGIPEFNFPAFYAAATNLRAAGWVVFNPAEKDNEKHGTDISKGNATGDESIATQQHGFNLREALAADLDFICREADAIALLPGWERSKGATAEHATAVALGLTVINL